MSVAMQIEKDFELMECGECGINYYVPYWFYRERKDHGKGWTCPNGHSRIYRESDVDRLKKQIEALKVDRDRVSNRADSLDRVLKRTKARIARGVCPECKRSFPNLHRHMDAKHPGYEKVRHIG